MKNIVGDEQFLELKKTAGFDDAMKSFDREVKPSFGSDPNQAWNINFTMAGLKDDPANGVQSNALRLT